MSIFEGLSSSSDSSDNDLSSEHKRINSYNLMKHVFISNPDDYELASQGKTSGVVERISLDVHSLNELQKKNVPQTDDSYKYHYKVSDKNKQKFADYEFGASLGKILAIRTESGFVDSVKSGELCGVILDNTCFYAEQGGQIYDEGYISKIDDEASEIFVKNVQVQAGYILHIGIVEGHLAIGDKIICNIDEKRRRLIMSNHTATHILNHALRHVLGPDTDQKGSLVAPDRLRFDFTSKSSVKLDELKKVENEVNKIVNEDNEVFASCATLEEAKKINGLRAMFSEAYPDPVRVVSVGVPIHYLIENPQDDSGLKTSVEFCGGTHLKRSSHVGDFIITNEEAIAKGIRRIIAVTGPEAEKAQQRVKALESSVLILKNIIEKNLIDGKEMLKSIVEHDNDVSKAPISYWKKDELRNILKNLKKVIDNAERAGKTEQTNKVIEEAKNLMNAKKGTPFLVATLNAGSNSKALDSALKQVKVISPETAAMFFSVEQTANKIICLCSVPQVCVEKGLKGNEWIQSVSSKIGGKGGGKAESAQASGNNVNSLSEVLKIAEDFAKLKLSVSGS